MKVSIEFNENCTLGKVQRFFFFFIRLRKKKSGIQERVYAVFDETVEKEE